ncbi:hypothetical protein BGZ95_001385 [Linnemannia exigua]|uniref:Ndc10 domain-containing protein n=1 Tax=Linnemannia exigua TaxID=604196 RepID=A0AAD4D6Y1_9FUNG|nr:hypothetical protein BGZ95_001385 [Linnemannia exigua]
MDESTIGNRLDSLFGGDGELEKEEQDKEQEDTQGGEEWEEGEEDEEKEQEHGEHGGDKEGKVGRGEETEEGGAIGEEEWVDEEKDDLDSEARRQTPSSRSERNRAHVLKTRVAYQRHWKDWCIRKRYDDRDKVTPAKFVSWVEELTAETEYRNDYNPHLSVFPLVHSTSAKGDVTRRYSVNTIIKNLRYIRQLYDEQRIKENLIRNSSKVLPTELVAEVLRKYGERIKNAAATTVNHYKQQNANSDNKDDIQDEVTKRPDGVSDNSLLLLKMTMQALWAWSPKQYIQDWWKLAAQDRFRLAFDRFKNPRHKLSNILLLHLHFLHIESHINEDDAAPDFEDAKWKLHVQAVDIMFEDEPDLASRFAEIDNANIDEEEEEVLNNNSTGKIHDLATYRLPGDGITVSLSTTLSKASVFQLPRNRVLPPLHLQQQLFPFIEDAFPGNDDWKAWIDNIMLNRSEDTNRASELKGLYKKSTSLVVRVLILLVRLRRVILQDFAVMMVSAGNEGDIGGNCASFAHELSSKFPVLTSPDYLEYASYLRDATVRKSTQSSRAPPLSYPLSDEDAMRLVVQRAHSTTATNRKLGGNDDGVQSDSTTITDRSSDTDTDTDTNTDTNTNAATGFDDQPWHENPNAPQLSSTTKSSATAAAIRSSSDALFQGKGNGDSTNARFRNMDDSMSTFLQHEIRDLRDKVLTLENQVEQLSDDNRRLRHQHHTFGQHTFTINVQSDAVDHDHDPDRFRQEIQSLRTQLAAKEREKMDAMDAVTVAIEAASQAIESERALGNKVAEMEQSIQGLWTMVAEAKANTNKPRLSETGKRMELSQQELLKSQLDAFRRELAISAKLLSQS